LRRRTPNRPQMVHKNIDNIAERDAVLPSTSGGRIWPTRVPTEGPSRPVKQEPAPVPNVQTSPSHLVEGALAGRGGELDDVGTVFEAVAGRLDELTQVEGRVTDRKIAGQRSRLHIITQFKMQCEIPD